jgi:hypothetical protein
LRRVRTASVTGLCNHLPGPATGASCIVRAVPAPSAASSIRTRASPRGRPRARRTRSRPGSTCSTAPGRGPDVLDCADVGATDHPVAVQPTVRQDGEHCF